MKRAFTLVELLVVVGMILVLIGSMTVSVRKARTRAKVSRALQEAKEMTNAILAYEHYAPGRTLEKEANDSWAPCTENAMGMILGAKPGANGETVPVLYNAIIAGDSIVDPWGTPYEYMIKRTGTLSSSVPQLKTAPVLPNFFRLTDKERQ